MYTIFRTIKKVHSTIAKIMSSNNSNNKIKKPSKRRKVPQASKKDKSVILSALIASDYTGTSFFDAVSSINPDILKRSLNQILNANLDYDSLSDSKRSIDQFLEDTDVVVRFAPAPSGQLHVGHIVPLILNALIVQINRNYGRSPTMVIRIDDTDPDILNDRDEACAGIDILDTLMSFLRIGDLSDLNIVCYNSSDHLDQIVGAVLDSMRGGSSYFYADSSLQDDIKHQRLNRLPSPFRSLDVADRIAQLDQILVTGGVIRARIDHASDNGNLRDPVLIRVQNQDGVVKFYPTYDLVCPVLDLYDSNRFDTSDGSGSHTLLAMRDCNYLDRLDQYQWIQDALLDCAFVKSGVDADNVSRRTSMLTFSRIQIENALLSKRKIKALIQANTVDGWDDPRLFTIPGILRRGMTLAGLANFYWVIGTISASNRASVMTLQNFFAHYDKVLSRTVTPIVNRLPVSMVVPDGVDTVYDCQIISYRDVVFDGDDTHCDTKVIGQIRIDLNQILTANLMNYKKVDIDPDHINTVGVDARAVCDDLKTGDFSDLFFHGTDLKIGQTVKLNNFKDSPTDAVYGGFYLIIDIDHDTKRISLSTISD